MSIDQSLAFNHLPIPVSFRSLDIGHGFVEYPTVLVSLFQNGCVISSPKKLRLGSILSIRMRMPPERAGDDFWHRRCAGRVVAEQRVKHGALGYRIAFESRSPFLQ
jgi:hypothetical protein